MVKNITPQQSATICEELPKDVLKNGSGNVRYWINDKFKAVSNSSDLHTPWVEDHVVEKVVGTITASGVYIAILRTESHGYDYMIRKNPAFELDENIKATNNPYKKQTGRPKTLILKLKE